MPNPKALSLMLPLPSTGYFLASGLHAPHFLNDSDAQYSQYACKVVGPLPLQMSILLDLVQQPSLASVPYYNVGVDSGIDYLIKLDDIGMAEGFHDVNF